MRNVIKFIRKVENLVNTPKKEKGFTIIEVVLVLAIAGLIFMMVFIALPALQRNQRDTQRKNDMDRAEVAVVNYASNNRGSLPTNWSTFTTQYLTTSGDSFIDPSGANTTEKTATSYLFKREDNPLTDSFNASTTQNVIYYSVGASCGDSGAVVAAGARKVALRMYLEGGGVFCVNN